jgi:hypothetical protein
MLGLRRAYLHQHDPHQPLVHTYIHTYTHTYIHTHTHTYIHTYTHTYIHTYLHQHDPHEPLVRREEVQQPRQLLHAIYKVRGYIGVFRVVGVYKCVYCCDT